MKSLHSSAHTDGLLGDLAGGGSGHADTIYSYPTRAAGFADLRDHAVLLMDLSERHGLHRVATATANSATAINLIISLPTSKE